MTFAFHKVCQAHAEMSGNASVAQITNYRETLNFPGQTSGSAAVQHKKVQDNDLGKQHLSVSPASSRLVHCGMWIIYTYIRDAHPHTVITA